MLEKDTLGGRKPMKPDDAEAALDLGKGAGLKVRASKDDLAPTNNHWEGGPHIHVGNIGSRTAGHIRVQPGVTPQ